MSLFEEEHTSIHDFDKLFGFLLKVLTAENVLSNMRTFSQNIAQNSRYVNGR